jgi:hypothetical protein
VDVTALDATLTPTAPRRRKRGYSRDFSPRTGAGRNYLLARVPAALWTAAQLKARREGLSMRALLCRLLADWTADGQ